MKRKFFCLLLLALLLVSTAAGVFAASEPQPGSETDTPITPGGQPIDPNQLLYDPEFDLLLVEPADLEAWYASEVKIPDASLKRALTSACAKADGEAMTVYDMIYALPETLDISKLEISDLTGMEYAINVRKLYASGNKLEDISPLKNLYNLTYLDISQNSIAFLPGWLFSMHSLSILNASGNKASSITAVTTAESTITELYLENNELTALPDLSCCKKLTALSLSGNNMTHFPSSIAQLSSLQTISLANNALTAAPDLSGFPALAIIDLSGNELDAFPSGMSLLSKITKISLSHNAIKEIPAEITALPALETLNIAFNELTDLPAELSKMTALKALDLSMNRINLAANKTVLDELIVKLSSSSFFYKLQSVNFTLKITEAEHSNKPRLVWEGAASASATEGYINVDKIVIERRPYELSSSTQLLTFEQIAVLDSTAAEYIDETAEKNTDYSYRVTVYVSGRYGTDYEINDYGSSEIDTTMITEEEATKSSSTVKIIVGIAILLVLLGVLGVFFYIRRKQNLR